MRYYLKHCNGGWWLRYRFVNSDGKEEEWGCDCPYQRGEHEHTCGSWCPLFDVRERDRIPQVDAPDKVRLSVRLHCGAGTRVIEVECGEKEGA